PCPPADDTGPAITIATRQQSRRPPLHFCAERASTRVIPPNDDQRRRRAPTLITSTLSEEPLQS
ncbi:hypothetical protein, partial [Gordonia paraffinivorans]|uniref:hypothetical protein n=1 Tax=Gordonia paraffinivorans TaxID=175628 RepID=UPI001B35595B